MSAGRMGTVDVYLDVDGVINAVYPSDSSPEWGWSRPGENRRASGFPIHYSPELVAALNELAARPHVRFHWLTTWLDHAPRYLTRRIGLHGKDWPVVGKMHMYSRDAGISWWKLAAIQEHVDPSNRIVWIDDDLIDDGAREWAASLGDRILLVQPDPYVGITKDMFKFIDDWIEGK